MTNEFARSNSSGKSLIAVFIDGTLNDATPSETEGRTNVRRMFEEMESHPDAIRLYLPGVGCDAVAEMDPTSACDAGIVDAVGILLRTGKVQRTNYFGGLFGEYFGAGLTARVLAAYAFVCAAREQYPSARLCIVGFSRGAYACCVLAHFMSRAGLVVAKRDFGLHLDTVRNAWTYDDRRLTAMIRSGESTAWQLPTDAEAIRVDFLGCWDTICAMGAPEDGLNLDVCPRLLGRAIDGLCGLVHRQVKIWNPRFVQLFVPPNVVKARHAVALHEYRVSFEALLWTHPEKQGQILTTDVIQMWFPGAHADVGGGYLENDASSVLCSHALRWMKNEMCPDRWFGWDCPVNAWSIHDSSSGKFKKMRPRIRRSLTHMTADQFPTVEMSEWLQFGLIKGPQVWLCDDRELTATHASLVPFQNDIAALHAQVHALARLAWLSGVLARAAAKHTKGSIPSDYAFPDASEALEALSVSTSDFFSDLSAAGLATMATDRARSDRVARLCCYHLALMHNFSALTEAARIAINLTEGSAAKAAAIRVLSKVLLAPIAFVLGNHAERSARAWLAIHAITGAYADGKVVKL